jgi:hypothetical protein
MTGSAPTADHAMTADMKAIAFRKNETGIEPVIL